MLDDLEVLGATVDHMVLSSGVVARSTCLLMHPPACLPSPSFHYAPMPRPRCMAWSRLAGVAAHAFAPCAPAARPARAALQVHVQVCMAGFAPCLERCTHWAARLGAELHCRLQALVFTCCTHCAASAGTFWLSQLACLPACLPAWCVVQDAVSCRLKGPK